MTLWSALGLGIGCLDIIRAGERIKTGRETNVGSIIQTAPLPLILYTPPLQPFVPIVPPPPNQSGDPESSRFLFSHCLFPLFLLSQSPTHQRPHSPSNLPLRHHLKITSLASHRFGLFKTDIANDQKADSADIFVMLSAYILMHGTFVNLFLSMRKFGSKVWLGECLNNGRPTICFRLKLTYLSPLLLLSLRNLGLDFFDFRFPLGSNHRLPAQRHCGSNRTIGSSTFPRHHRWIREAISSNEDSLHSSRSVSISHLSHQG